MTKKKLFTAILTALLMIIGIGVLSKPQVAEAAKEYQIDGTYVKNNKDFKKVLKILPHSGDCGNGCIGLNWTLSIIDKETGNKTILRGEVYEDKNSNGEKIKNSYWLFDDSENSDFIGDVVITVKATSDKTFKVKAEALTNNGKGAIAYYNLSGKYKLKKRYDYSNAS